MQPIKVILLLGLVSWICGCGGNANSPKPTPTPVAPPQFTIASGDWAISLMPQGGTPLLAVGGSLVQAGGTVSGIIHMIGSTCFDSMADDLGVSGSVSGNTLSFNTAPVRGQILTVTATPQSSGTGNVVLLSGTWSLTGPCAAGGTSGAFFVPPMNGTFAGPLSGGMSGSVTATLSQTGPDVHGFSHVSGSFTFSGFPCFTTGTIGGDGVVFAGQTNFTLNTNDGGQTAVSAFHVVAGTFIDNVNAELAVETGSCSGQVGLANMKKQ